MSNGKKVFSVKFIESLKPKTSPYRIWEGGGKSFGVQVSPASKRNPNGKKAFFMSYRFGDDPNLRYCPLGIYDPSIGATLSKAGEELRIAKEDLDNGIDPQVAREEKKIRKAQELEQAKQAVLKEQSIGTVKQLFDCYTNQMEADKKKSWKETKRALYKYALYILGEKADNKLPEDKKAKDVTSQDIRKILFNLVDQETLVQANRLRSYLSAAFNYGIGYDLDSKNLKHEVMFYLGSNPVRDVPKPKKKEEPGERDLSWKEIKKFWHTIEADQPSVTQDTNEYQGRLSQQTKDLIFKIRRENPTFGKLTIHEVLKKRYSLNISKSTVGRVISNNLKNKKIMPVRDVNNPAIALKFMLTTGQRVTEVLSAGPHDFYFDTNLWEILDTKNGKMHVVPLNDLSVSIIKPLVKEAIAKGSKYLFPKKGSGHDGKEEPMPEGSLSQYTSRFCSREEELTKEQRAAGEKPKKIFKKFTPRDIRRTWKSRTGELGISKEIRDRIQNHALDDVSSKHYDRYDYLKEKREALDKWGEHLQKVISGDPLNG